MSITVQIKQVYGNETIYPVCEKAKAFADIAGHQTLTRITISAIKRLGYEVRVQQGPVSL